MFPASVPATLFLHFMALPNSPVVFFDGVCNLCNSSVHFLLDRDRRNILKFAPLQGETYAELRARYPEAGGDVATIVLYNNGRVFTQSTAVLHILRLLGVWWKLLYGGMIIPKPLRDMLYSFIARNRYRWFGRQESCRMPTPELRAKFLD